MANLLRAEYNRLFKTKLFLAISAVMGLFGIALSLYMCWMKSKFGDAFAADENFYQYSKFCGIVAAVFISLFVGKQYSDGTMRNMVIMGHSRTKLYICETIVTFTAQIIMYLAYIFGNAVISYPVFRKLSMPVDKMLLRMLLSVLVIAVYTALFVLFAMLNKNKAAVATTALLVSFGLLMVALIVNSTLNEPPIFEEQYYFDTETKTLVKEEAMPNPNYIDGVKREIYQFLNDSLPSGQAFQLGGSVLEAKTEALFAVYDTLILIFLSATGIIVFRRKNLN